MNGPGSQPGRAAPRKPSELDWLARHAVDVQLDGAFVGQVDAEDLARAAAAALLTGEVRPAEPDQPVILTVVVTDDATVAALNREYLGVDGPTDVLAFSAREAAPGFVIAPDAAIYLGDVLIALPYALRQASEMGRPLADELRLLTVHGVLHLLGYDHAEPAAEVAMWAQQKAILNGLAQDR